jgi:hypothetical protein
MQITASVNSAPWLIRPAFWRAEPLSALARQKVAHGSQPEIQPDPILFRPRPFDGACGLGI